LKNVSVIKQVNQKLGILCHKVAFYLALVPLASIPIKEGDTMPTPKTIL